MVTITIVQQVFVGEFQSFLIEISTGELFDLVLISRLVAGKKLHRIWQSQAMTDS